MKNLKLKFEKELKYKLELKSNGRTTEETILLKAFKYFDLDNSGKCSQNEFIKTINKIGITGFTDDDINELFKKYDKDNSGYLDYKEFISILYPNDIINETENDNNNNIQNNINQNNNNEKNNIDNNNIENNINENNNLISEEKELDSGEKIIEKIRKKLSLRGIRGITSLAKTFRLMDVDNSQTIDYNEFKTASNEFRFDLTENEIQIVFLLFDRNKNGVIDYDEFIRVIRGEMNDKRKKIVEDIFNYLDTNNSKAIEIEEIKSKFNAKNHPDVLNKKKTEDEILLEFIETFENTYNYLSGTENDGKVTLEEFMEYYENISLSIDDDNYFELLLNNTWRINNNENNNINNNLKDLNNKNENENINDNNNTLQENYNRRFGDNKNNNFNQLKTKEQNENNEFNSNENELLNLFRNEIRKKGGRGIINLARQFRLFDENNSKTLELNEFTKSVKDLKLNLNDDEIKELFSSFDIDKSNTINYNEFLKQLRGEMNEKRKNIVIKAFDKLDLDKSGNVELNEIKSLYNFKNNKDVLNGKKSEEEVFNEFIETFETHHNLKKGFRDKRVSKEEFIEYYNNISMSIDDDDLFIELISNSWKLNNQSKYLKNKSLNNAQDNNNKINKENYNINEIKINDNNTNNNNNNLTNKNLNQNYNIITNINNNLNQENDKDNNIRKRNKYLNEKNQKIGNSQNAPFGTDNEPVNYSTWNNPNNMKMRFYENNNISNKKLSIDPIKKLKNEIIKRGIRGIMSLRRNFMISDVNNNGNINLNELKRFCNDYLINLDDEEINNLFNIYDKNGKGIINYEDLVNEIIGEMNNFRKEVVRKVFYKFNRNNLVDLDVLRKNYNAKEHPDVLNGKKKYLECLAEFLDCFEYHFSLLNNNRHSKINLNELYDFYNNISMNIDNDLYFENMMNGVWDLKNW